MKKKIKDLTLEECQKICDTHSCISCPLFPYGDCEDLTIRVKKLRPDWAEKEVEVDESDND